jgi:periplasmic protein TonB
LAATLPRLAAIRNLHASSIKTGLGSLHDAAHAGGTMKRDTSIAPRPNGRPSSSGPMGPGRRFLLLAVVLSVAVHLAAALLVVYLPRVLPHEARPQEEGTVELLMVERKGAEPSPAGQPQESPPAQSQPEKKTDETKPEPRKPDTATAASESQAQKPDQQVAAPPVAPPPLEGADEATPPPAENTPAKEAKADNAANVQQQAKPPAPPKAQEAPVFDLAGTESESNADVLGGHVVPASPDDRFRNRPPIYPYEAAAHGEHGAVTLIIHVSEFGAPTGVDVVESSGVASLDQAAETAVRKWHFRPALQEGHAVPFDMPFRFVFEAD